MNTLLTLTTLLAFSPSPSLSPVVQSTQPKAKHLQQPTEPPAKKRVFTPFEQVFTIAQGGKTVDSIALYLIEPGPFDWKGRRENFTEWKMTAFDKGFESRNPVATFDRLRFNHAFDEPGIYALAFFRDGQEEWERHFFFFDSKWSDPRHEYLLNLTLHPRSPKKTEDLHGRQSRSTYHSAYN